MVCHLSVTLQSLYMFWVGASTQLTGNMAMNIAYSGGGCVGGAEDPGTW